MRTAAGHPEASELDARLRTHVERLAGLIGPRHFGVPSALNAAVALIDRELVEHGYDVQRQTYPVGVHEAVNLVAEIPGCRSPGEIVILGAHYDTVETTPGADDNASAVAVLLECARLLRRSSPRRTVRFVAFACEEPPHFYQETMGSQVHARACRAAGEKITGMLCLEMVGYYSSEPGSQHFATELPRWLRPFTPKRGDFLAAVANMRSWRLGLRFRRGFKRAVRFPLFSIALPEATGIIRLSDNSSFWDQGYPALMLTDTSFLRNPHYHLPTDTPETLDYQRMASVTIGVAGAVAHLAGGRLPVKLIDFDVHCARCGYNLRGRPILSRCSECGMHIGATIRAISRRELAIATAREWSIGATPVACALVVASLVLLSLFSALPQIALPVGSLLRIGAIDGCSALLIALIGHWIVRAPWSWFVPMLIEILASLLAGTTAFVLAGALLGDVSFSLLVILPAALIYAFTRISPADAMWFFVLVAVTRVPYVVM